MTAAQVLGALMAKTYDCRVMSHSYVCLSFGSVPFNLVHGPAGAANSREGTTRIGEMERIIHDKLKQPVHNKPKIKIKIKIKLIK